MTKLISEWNDFNWLGVVKVIPNGIKLSRFSSSYGSMNDVMTEAFFEGII